MSPASRTRTEIWPTERGLDRFVPSTFFLAVERGNQDEVVLVLAERGLALRLEDADDGEGDLLDADRLADGIGVAEQAVPDRVAEDGDLRAPRRHPGAPASARW
jgi:hypothetical protein